MENLFLMMANHRASYPLKKRSEAEDLTREREERHISASAFFCAVAREEEKRREESGGALEDLKTRDGS